MKTYRIKKIGVHDGYKSMEKELKGLAVVPLLDGPHLREKDEEVVLRKGAAPTIVKFGGTYFGEFSIPELQVQQTHFAEVYLTVSDTDRPDVPEEDVEEKQRVAAIDAKIAKLLKERGELDTDAADPLGGAEAITVTASLGAAKTVTEKTGIGYLVVEDDSEMPKNVPESGWKKLDKNGEPMLDQPGDAPALPPVSAEEKQAKFDRAEETAEEKRRAEMNEKMAMVRAAKGGKK